LRLAEAGHRVTLFDKGRRPGGRIATRRANVPLGTLTFNHGAQYTTARGADLMQILAQLQSSSESAPWPQATRTEIAWVGTPGMSTLTQALANRLTASGATILCDRHVSWRDDTGRLRHLAAGDARPGQVIEAGELTEPFDAVLLALPAPQAAPLFATTGHGFAARMAEIVMAPCWATMLAFEHPVEGEDMLRPNSGPLAWIARETARPGSPQGPDRWMLHASAAWSREHLDDTAEQVQHALIAVFQAAMATNTAPAFAASHRWRHAQVEQALGTPCLWDRASKLGYCGDGCIGPRIEAAHDSGIALARTVLAAA
jgi:predicted NAD/FAD-dependent oxidoreductase